MNIYYHLQSNVPESWEAEFRESDEGIRRACECIREDGIVSLPPDDLVFNAFHYVKKQDVRVVIVGQNPYHTEGMAHGLSFSCLKGVPPSLKTIYKELERSVPGFRAPNHGNLSAWCKQGVLLLNLSLTVEKGNANYKPLIWMDLMDSIVAGLTNYNKNIIWMMWGQKAQRLTKIIGTKGVKLLAAHPSPMNTGGGFVGCNHFVTCNEMLKKRGLEPIDWSL